MKYSNFGLHLEQGLLSLSCNSQYLVFGISPFLEKYSIDIQDVILIENKALFYLPISNQPIELIFDFDPNFIAVVISISTNGNQSFFGTDALGIIIDQIPLFEVGLAFHKYEPVKAWTIPIKINHINDLESDNNQFFYWKNSDNHFGAIMPLLGNGYVATIGKNEKQQLYLKSKCLFDNFEAKKVPLAVIAFDKNPYQLFDNIYEIGLNHIGKSSSLRKNKQFPELFKKLMWCTWNAHGHSVDEQKILEGLESFKQKSIPISNILIDDGWSQVSEYGTGKLQSFEPNFQKFPNGINHLVEIAKTCYRVKNIGIWHTLNGYWAGIDPDSILFEKYKNDLIAYIDKVTWTENELSVFYTPNPNIKNNFYNDWYAFLKGQGISFIKVDNQLIADRICRNNFPYSLGAQNLQHQIQVAATDFFNGDMINCMEMTTDAIYNLGNSAIARCSEDYFPDNQSFNIRAGNAAIHILCNFYNSIWLSHIVFPDFDMFQSHHPNAEFHAVARVLSAGPIYITDIPYLQNAELISKLILTDGTILKLDSPALPTQDCLFLPNQNEALKVFSFENEIGIIGAFNTHDADNVIIKFQISDIFKLNFSFEYILFQYFDNSIISICYTDYYSFNLCKLSCELFFIIPIKNRFAPIGLINKYLVSKTILEIIYFENYIEIELVENGEFWAYCSIEPIAVISSENKFLEYVYENRILKIFNCYKNFRISNLNASC